uniref:Arrestin C-terminal-like domain-containing protein n=1 Tax=Parascaris univalens TaxID=6257 RepID=A0A914ZQ00_PARUN
VYVQILAIIQFLDYSGMGSVERRNEYDIDLLLSEKMYGPGDIIQGQIQFSLNRKLFCDTIIAQLYGIAKVFWTTNEAHNDSFQPVAHVQKRTLIDKKVIVWNAENKKQLPPELSMGDIIRLSSPTAIRPKKVNRSEDDCGLEPGRHSMCFSFDLPKGGLHTSFEQPGCGGCVQYFILVQCLFNEQLIAKRKLLFPLVCPVDLMDNPIATESADVNRKINFGKNAYLNVQLHLAKKGFVPGERIPVRIFIDNRSGKSVKYAHLSIVQHAFCMADYPYPVDKHSCMEASGVGLPIHKIVNDSAYKYIPEFNVPALVPDFEIPGCIHVDHTLKFEVGFSRKAKPQYSVCVITIPIFVGTSGVDGKRDAHAISSKHSEEYDSCITSEEAAGETNASAYSPYTFSIPPPPSYTESEEGASDVQEGDDDCPSYTAVCYRYSDANIAKADNKKNDKVM